MKKLSYLGLIINWKTFVLAAIAMLATWLCLRYEIKGDFPLTIISTAVIFPIVFSIGHAYKRREVTLDDYGTIKAHGRAIYFAARDWLPERSEAREAHAKAVLEELFESIRALFKGNQYEMFTNETRVYGAFSQLSEFVKRLRADGLPSGECSRCNQYISKMVVSFEHAKHVYQYRTPRSLRAFSDFFIILLPILYGPYFAHEAGSYHPALAYVMPLLFAVILVGLDNIQIHLEDPFDQIGPDDVTINAEKFVELLSAGEAAEA
ncbi:MAG: hypothetical protein HKN36_06570 [Hellea sp.]|nr:hypothetical protein [Hellea sp.]